jgi:hypothetical protein
MKKLKTNFIAILTLSILCGWSNLVNSQNQFIDDFNGTTIHSNWTVVNPNPPSSALLTGNGEMNITATPLNGGSDYWPSINFKAPRIITPVSGDWSLEVKMRFNPTAPFEGAGILILPDTTPSGTNGIRIFERFYDSNNGQRVLNCSKYYNYTDTIVYIRLNKIDTTIIGSFSPDSINWSNEDTTYVSDTINYIGLHTIRKSYNTNMKDALAYFDYFYLTTSPVLSIENIENKFGFSLYPNPAKEYISITSSFGGKTIVEIFDIQGKRIMNSTILLEKDNAFKMNLPKMVSGLYFISLTNEKGESQQQKIIIE